MTSQQTDVDPFEHNLRAALHVDVPEGLAQRILDRQAQASHRHWWELQWIKPNHRARYMYAVAASIVVAVGLSVASSLLGPSSETLEAQILAYAAAEYQHAGKVGGVPDADVEEMFHAIGAQVRGNLGTVNYCTVTEINEKKSALLVLPGHKAPITVVFILGEHVGERTAIANREFNGTVFPVERGSVAIVGVPGENLEEVEHKVRSLIKWV